MVLGYRALNLEPHRSRQVAIPLNYIISPFHYFVLRQGLAELPRVALNLGPFGLGS